MNKTVSKRGKMAVRAVKAASSFPVLGKKLQDGSLRKKLNAREGKWQTPEHMQLFEIEHEHFKMEWLSRKRKLSVEQNPTWVEMSLEESLQFYANRGVILQLHGGGYYAPIRNKYRNLAALYNEVSDDLAVLSVDYRVAPENPFPAALEDGLNAYQWLIKNGIKSEYIYVVGDSAGGGLALALCLYLRDHQLDLPAGIITMSAWTDLTKQGETYESNFKIDPLFGNNKESLVYKEGYFVNQDPANPYISPIFGDFNKFPPMLMQVGEREMLLSDTVELAKKAKNQGIDVTTQIYKDMYHVFQMGELLYPESHDAWVQVGRFIRRRRTTLSGVLED